MARIRSIKPEFFDDPEIAALTPWARLCFIGLWLQADREGRIVLDLRRLKVRIFPYDDIDLGPLLDELVRQDFVRWYAVEKNGEPGKETASREKTRQVDYLWIRSFSKHQRPHPKEPPSVIPMPDVSAVKKHGEPWKKTASRVDLGMDPGSGDLGSGDLGSGDDGSGDDGSPRAARPAAPAPSSSTIPKTSAGKKNRPVFDGSRFVCFEWQVREIERMLGSHAEAFDISAFLFELDERQRAGSDVIPPAEIWPWLQSQVLAEARKRGLPIADTAPPKSTANSRLMDSVARFVAGGS